jgi:lipopolysaccharide transport system permease protein
MFRQIAQVIRYRELLWVLAVKDLKIKYKSALLGFGWMLAQPLAMTFVFAFIFRTVFDIREPNYVVFLLCGLFPWSFLSVSVNLTTDSILRNSNLIKKTYFPREILPLSQVLSNILTYSVALVLLLAFMPFAGVPLSWTVLLLPAGVIVHFTFVVGLSLMISGLDACYRDISYMFEVIMMVWFYATPVFYSPAMADRMLSASPLQRFLVEAIRMNPMTWIVGAYRDVMMHGHPPGMDFAGAACVAALALALGLVVFRNCERVFVDIL